MNKEIISIYLYIDTHIYMSIYLDQPDFSQTVYNTKGVRASQPTHSFKSILLDTILLMLTKCTCGISPAQADPSSAHDFLSRSTNLRAKQRGVNPVYIYV